MSVLCNFEKIVKRVIWKQRRTSTHNMLCGENNCYSNCYTDLKTIIPLRLKGLLGRPCRRCNHSLWNHHRCSAQWEPRHDTQVSVDQNMKKRWEEAKNGKERAETLVVASEKVLHDLNQIINRATNDLEQLVGDYGELSLSGSFSAQVGSAVKLLEQNYAALEQKLEQNGVGEDQLRKVKRSMDHMKKKLALLNDSKENT